MKKIVLLLSFIPVALFAQNSPTKPVNGIFVKGSVIPKEGQISPVQNIHQAQPNAPVANHNTKPRPQPDAAYIPSVSTVIGTTVYDLQTNGALAKRLQFYTGSGLESYVWIKSDDVKDNAFTTRYSGYNSYNGSTWLSKYGNTTQYEFDRSGWPSIGEVTSGGKTYEMLTSHYAAAGSTTYAGGIYWYKNSGIGQTDFTKTIDLSNNRALTNGLLWPRMATSGDKIYMIGTYEDDRVIKGVINPVVYYRYNTTTGTFTVKGVTLPGYDSSRVGSGGADIYSIDARDSFVAILIGGDLSSPNDLALWKSSDSGKTFKKTIIDSFAHAPWNYKVDNTFQDTALMNDGTGSVALGKDGIAHVTWSPMFVTNPNPYSAGDSALNGYFPDNSGIWYWNDKDKQKIEVGKCIDYDQSGETTLIQNLNANNANENTSGYGHNFACYSNISIDPLNRIFVVFSAPHEDDLYSGNWVAAYRHVYCSVFDGTKWHSQQDIVQTWQLENVYATVARDADSKLRMVFMQDDVPGIYFPLSTTTQQSETTDTMIYQEISTADLLSDKIGLINLGLDQKLANTLFSAGSIYPNPTADKLNLSLNLTRPATVVVTMYNMLGQEMQVQNYTTLPSGINNLQFGVSSLPSGVYMCNISAGGYTTTERVVVER